MTSGGFLSRALLYASIPFFAVLVASLTSIWHPYAFDESGFPLSWQTRTCFMLLNLNDGFSCTPVSYDWIAFGFDVFFYGAIGYVLVLGYLRNHHGKPETLSPKQV